MKHLFTIIFLISIFLPANGQIKELKNKNEEKNDKIKIGVFNGNGAGAVSVVETIEALKIDPDIKAFPISPVDIAQGKLKEIDAIIFPGGSGSKQLNSLGASGKQKILEYVKNGHGIIGICAGAYMLCQTKGYPGLKMGDVKHIDRAHYNRGRGLIEFKLNQEGLKIFPEFKGKPQFIQYYDGPVMEALYQEKSFTPVATYVTDIHPNKGTPVGITPGKLFMYHQNYGEGRIFAIGGHAESTPGIRFMIPRMARWVTRNKLIKYHSKWIKPEKNNQPILFNSKLKKQEKALFWQLFDAGKDKRMEAMKTLYKLRSRPAVRWNVGMLRDLDPQVRALATQLLQKAEYTAALPDLITAYKMEKNPKTQKAIGEAVEFLQY